MMTNCSYSGIRRIAWMRAPRTGFMVSMRTKPEDAYAAAQVESARLLAEITRLLAAHQDARAPEEVTWDAVGDLQATIEKLGEVRSFLANEG